MPGQCPKGGRVAVKPRESVRVHEVFLFYGGLRLPLFFPISMVSGQEK
jgi:hypothetical protein